MGERILNASYAPSSILVVNIEIKSNPIQSNSGTESGIDEDWVDAWIGIPHLFTSDRVARIP
jgi:hypothetical protein